MSKQLVSTMYKDYFSLKEKPFSITPDPAYLFLSERHAEALAHLLYGVTDSGGFIQLTGEVGTGKTTTVRSLLQQLPENVNVALILNPRLSINEFLQAICDELRIEISHNASNKECIDCLNKFLLDAYANDRKVVLLVDEAQNLSIEVLEQIRLLTNLETHKDKLLQIILVGQPELQTVLQRNDLRQLSQRITARYHLLPLNEEESIAYLSHRLKVANGQPELFTLGAKKLIYKKASGIPRLMNVIAERALLGAYAKEKKVIDRRVVKRSFSELDEVNYVHSSFHKSLWRWLGILGIALSATFLLAQTFKQELSQWLNNEGPHVSSILNANLNTQSKNVTPSEVSVLRLESELNSIEDISGKERGVDKRSADEILDANNTQEQLDESYTDALSDILIAHPQWVNSEYAFNELLSLWDKKPFVVHDNACENLLAQGLVCYYKANISWTKVKTFNRPAIVELKVDNTLYYLAVAKVSASGIKISGASHTQIAQKELLNYWTGNVLYFLDLSGVNFSESLSYGAKSESVLWLKKQLNELGVEPKSSFENDNYDDTLYQQVFNFQTQQQLYEDGIAGRETVLMINSLVPNSNVPKLIGDK